jgi:phage tail protein X
MIHINDNASSDTHRLQAARLWSCESCSFRHGDTVSARLSTRTRARRTTRCYIAALSASKGLADSKILARSCKRICPRASGYSRQLSDIEVDFDIVASNRQLLSKCRALAEVRTAPVDDIDGNDEDE